MAQPHKNRAFADPGRAIRNLNFLSLTFAFEPRWHQVIRYIILPQLLPSVRLAELEVCRVPGCFEGWARV